MKRGQRLPKGIEEFILTTKKASPEFTQAQIAGRVEARFRVQIDKTTVGRVIHRAGLISSERASGDQVFPDTAEDPEQAERSGHWPALRDDAATLHGQLYVPFAQLRGFPWQTSPDYNPNLLLGDRSHGFPVALEAERSVLFVELKEHLPSDPLWHCLDEYKKGISTVSQRLHEVCDRIRGEPELNDEVWESDQALELGVMGLTYNFVKTVALEVAEGACNLPTADISYELSAPVKRRKWTLCWFRHSTQYVIIAAANTRREVEELGAAHMAFRKHVKTNVGTVTPVVSVATGHRRLMGATESLKRELERIRHLAVFPGTCRLFPTLGTQG